MQAANPSLAMPAEPADADWLMVGAVLLALFGYSLLESMIAPALPEIRQALGATPAQLGLVFIGFFLAGAVSTPLIGALADIFPKRRVLCVMLALVALGAAMSGVADRIETLALGQVLQGLGLGMVPLTVGLLGETLPQRSLAFGNGLMIAALTSSLALGLLLAGPVVAHLGFRGIYGLALVVLIPCGLVVLFRGAPAKKVASAMRRRIDWLGALLLALWLVALLAALSVGPEVGWASPAVLGLLAVSGLLAAVWVAFELRRNAPLLDLRLIARPAVALACTTGFAVGFASVSVYVLMPQMLQAQFQADAQAVGLYMLPIGIAGFIAGPLTGMLERRLGARGVLVLGTLVLAAAVALPIGWREQGWQVLASMALLGVGSAFVLSEAMNIVLRVVGVSHAAGVSGIFFVIRSIGGTLGAQVSATVLGASTSASGTVTAAGYTLAFEIAAVVAVLGIAAAAAFPKLPLEANQ